LNAAVPANVAVGALANFDMLALIPDDVKRDSTIVRIRGELVLRVGASAGGAGATIIWYAGMVPVTEQAMAAGSASLPDPELDDGDFMWHDMGLYLQDTVRNDADSADLEVANTRYIEIDSKAMRKLNEDNQTLAYVFKNDASSSETVRQSIAARILLLHG